ncbi:MAG: helix-turn-helix transcriptional regulator [Parvibaculaceae bacterium]|nr:helix-turn-helix transcriptional regulator [Parvibaculaceae bacterium]
MAGEATQNFKAMCRQWRQYRNLSQLDLALKANVSQRHVSYLETGRSSPSREMVVQLATAMDVPLRERNRLLHSAGYSEIYTESGLDTPSMAPVLDALGKMLDHHDPFPAVVFDPHWNVKKQNTSARLLLGAGGDPADMMAAFGDGGEINLALLTIHPKGLRQYIVNWEEVGPMIAQRLEREMAASRDPALQKRFTSYAELLDTAGKSDIIFDDMLPVAPLKLNIDGLELSLFSVISTFGTPQDITTDELRIETFYPMDEATDQFFKAHALSTR